MKFSTYFFSGLMLMSFFFGAGNLIFPPMVGLQSGNHFLPATLGFVFTAIAMPMLTLWAIAQTPGGMPAMAGQVHRVFGLIFSICIYLSIGAMYGIPRASNVAFEMGFKPISPFSEASSLMLFVVVFFTCCYFAALHTSHLIDLVGKLLTPMLLITITVLCTLAWQHYHPSTNAVPLEKYASHPFATGLIDGYSTMDALAALAFGTVLINAINNPDKSTHAVKKEVYIASIVAGLLLGLIYFALAWIGSAIPNNTQFANGAELLHNASVALLGHHGSLLFGSIVILACMTTVIGLINACANFSHQLYPKITYRNYAIFFTVLGAVFSNLGLNIILGIAVPILVLLYPITIVLVLLTLLNHWLGQRGRNTLRFAIAVVVLFAINDMLASLNITTPWQTWINALPLASMGLAWALPVTIAAMIGFVLPASSTTEKAI